jgi:hypothetical protein
MEMVKNAIGLPAFLLLLLPTLAVAHHSHVNYDTTTTVTVTGVVTEVQWINPHTWFFVDVPGEDGATIEWALESGAPSQLVRRGWAPDSVQPGDTITAIVQPLRGASNGGLLGTIILSDGTELCDPFGGNLPLTTVCASETGQPEAGN